MRFTKSEFITAIDKLRDMLEEEHRISIVLDVSPDWGPGQWISAYYEMILDMCDVDRESESFKQGIDDVSYFCFELNFGKDWKPGMIIVDNEDIPCRNAEELWELMNRDQN